MAGKTSRARRVTIYDVADYAGVGISTVSRVLNDSQDVAQATRMRVLEAIRALEYRPHRGAKALAQRHIRSIAIAIPTFTTPFHNEFLKGVRAALLHQELDLLLFDLGSRDPLGTLLRVLKRGAVDGLLLAGVPVTVELAMELRSLRAPVVLVGHHHTDIDCFYWDNAAGTKAAIDHLVAMGHDRIAMIRAYTDSYLQMQRVEGFQSALVAGGLVTDERLIQSGTTKKHGGFSEEHGFEAMQRLLQLRPLPTAVFASSDVQAIGAWKAIRDAGLTVPDDIALVGYDDIKTSYFVGLSSVDQDMERVGRLAADRLLFRLDHFGTKERVDHRIIPRLQIRESSNFNRQHNLSAN